MKKQEQVRFNMLFSLLFILSLGTFAQNNDATSTNSVVHHLENGELQWGPCPEFMPEGCQIAVLHGDPAKRNVDILFQVPANSFIPTHGHTSAERMVLLSGELEVTYVGEEPQKLVPGSYAFGPAKKPHKAQCGSSAPCILFIAFEEPLDAYAIEK